jgi:sugar O-acyltransferase (sialic acid O-acetyltransferase NeuD family)
MMEKVILIGGGGHAKACVDVIEQDGSFEIAGILDEKKYIGNAVLKYKVIGTDDDIADCVAKDYWFVIAVGQIKSAVPRQNIYNKLISFGAKIATIISPLAYISPYAKIGIGAFVMHGAKVNAAAVIGNNSILNTNANIEHDVIVGDHCHVSTGAIINGGCIIGNRVFIGSGSIIKQGVVITENVVIGAGAIVSKSINEQGIYVGNPIKKIS